MSESTYWLGLDLSGANTSWSIALVKNNQPEIVFNEVIGHGQNHTEAMIPALISLFQKSNLSLSRVSKLLVSSGPGSYTGLRIAFSTLKAFALSKKLSLVAIPTHEAKTLTYCKSFNWEIGFDHLYCVSPLSANRYVCSHFRLRDKNQLEWVRTYPVTGLNDFQDSQAALILVDDQNLASLIPQEEGVEIKVVPMTAECLFFAYADSVNKKEVSDILDLVDLAPAYFGESFKPPVKKY